MRIVAARGVSQFWSPENRELQEDGLMIQNTLKPLAAVLACGLACGAYAGDDIGQGYRWVPVSGVGVHYFTTAIIHSQQPTASGMVQRSTDIVELDGDLEGRLLYHPVSVFDFAAGTLVNTGHQVFSGTVLGSDPVLIHDDEFRFDVNLASGETTGKVYLLDPIAGPKIRCELDVVGTGATPAGDAIVAYTGRCKVKRK